MRFQDAFSAQTPAAKITYIYFVGCTVWIFISYAAFRLFGLSTVQGMSASVLSGLLILILSNWVRRRHVHQATAKRLSAILEHAPVGIVISDFSGHVVEGNAAAQRMLGYSADELVGLPFSDYTHPDDLPRNLELRQQVKDGKLQSYDMEKRYIRKDRSIIWGRAVASILGTDSVITIIEDTTRRRQAEQQLRNTAERLQAILQHAPIGIVINDKEGRLVECNAAYQRMRNCSAEELRGARFSDCTHPDDFAKNTQLFNKMVSGEVPSFEIVKRIVNKDGQSIWTRVIGSKLNEETNIGIVEDVSARNQAEQQLQAEIAERIRAEEQLTKANAELKSRAEALERQTHEMELFAQLSSVLRACTDLHEAEGAIAKVLALAFPHCSGAVCILNNSRNLVQPAEHWGTCIEVASFAPDQCCALRLGHVHLGDGSQLIDCVHVQKHTCYVCAPLIAQGEILGTLFINAQMASDLENPEFNSSPAALAQAIAEQVAMAISSLKLRHVLRDAAIRDPLTGLFNRRYMEETFSRELARCARNNTPLTLLMIDIDHFKLFNDRHGHDVGDLVLKQVGVLLKLATRTEDVACRLGGEEFVIILPGANLETSVRRANELRVQFSSMSSTHRGATIEPVTVSIGVASTTKDGNSMEELMLAADRYLYVAKSEGRNKVCASSTELFSDMKVSQPPKELMAD